MKRLKFLLFLLLPVSLFAQEKTFDRYSSWNTIISDVHLNDKFYSDMEIHLRRTNFLADWQILLLRPGVYYKLNDNVSFGAGYSFIRYYNYSDYSTPVDMNESNIWEQVMLKHHSGKVNFAHRFRFEERFIDKVVENGGTYETKGNRYANRFRYRFIVGLPLKKFSDRHTLSADLFDEIWLNQDKGIAPKSFNMNWLYAGLSYSLSPKASIGIGYMNSYSALSGNNYENNNILQTTLKYHFN